MGWNLVYAENNIEGEETIIPPPLITVLMAVYNCEKYLSESIDSILRQTVSNFIFLIIDDASTDGTATILKCQAEQDSRIYIVTNESNLGLAASLNKGIAQVITPYIARMDADDIALPERLERQLSYMEEHPHISAVGCSVQLINAQGDKIEIWQPPNDSDSLCRSIRETGTAIPHPTAFIRTHAIKDIGGYRTFFTTTQDLDLWLRFLEKYHMANLPSILLLYRKHAASISVKKQTEQAINHILAMQAAEKRLLGQPDPLGGQENSIDLMFSLLDEGRNSTFMWLRLLLWRDIANKELYFPQAWILVLSRREKNRGDSLLNIWCDFRKNYTSIHHALLERARSFSKEGVSSMWCTSVFELELDAIFVERKIIHAELEELSNKFEELNAELENIRKEQRVFAVRMSLCVSRFFSRIFRKELTKSRANTREAEK